MMIRNVRLGVTMLYVIAILVSVFFLHGWGTTGAVAAIGAVVVGAVYAMTGPMLGDAGRERPGRAARRARRRG